MHIQKVRIELTLLLERKDEGWLRTLSLDQISREMDQGSVIGAMTTISSEPVALPRLEEELAALGNDGTFFDYLGTPE